MASSFVASASNQIGGLMVTEAKQLYRVKDKIERLQRDLQWMQCFLEDAYKRQGSEKMVAMWVDEIRDFAYKAEEIIEKYVCQVSHPRKNGKRNAIRWMLCALCDAQALHEVGSEIDELSARILELVSKLQLYGVKITNEDTRLGSDFAIWDRRQTYAHIKEDPVGLENHTRTVVEQLLVNKQVKVVSICGMGGLGKTTLARKVFQDAETREHFKNRAWVCISKRFEARVVFREILLELAKHKSESEKTELYGLTDGQLPEKICEIISQNPCLVVLDDIWSNGDWEALKPAFDSTSTSFSSKILITTRNNGLIQDGDPFAYSHSLNLLNEEDSWKLFTRKAFSEGESSDSDSTAKQELGLKMLKHCKGLPLAIIALGGVLRNKKTIAEWENVQRNITSYLMDDIAQGTENKGLFAMLELSYNDLPFYLKPCFMYLGVFPEDHMTPALKLYHLWEAEGLITIPTDEDEIQDVRLDDIAEMYLNELVKRCLVQVEKCWANGRISKIRLHDVLRDMCLKKCKEANFLTILKNGVGSSSKIMSSSHVVRKLRRCALYSREIKYDDSPFDLSSNPAPYIRSLLVFPGSTPWFRDDKVKKVISPNVGKFLSLLRVLHHENCDDIVQQPKILEHFIHLRYLSFKGAVISDTLDVPLPSQIWECKFLETLDLRCQFGGTYYMDNKLHKLQRLRHLYLPSDLEVKGKSGRLFLTTSQLQQMETLKNFDSKVCDIMDLRKMTSLRVVSFMRPISVEEAKHLLESPMIRRRRLVKPLHLKVEADIINDAGKSVLAEIQSRVCIDKFEVRGKIDEASNLEILQKMNLTELNLQDSQIDQQGISMLEKLIHLKELVLGRKSIASSKMRFSNGSFKELEVLHLSGLYGLEEWEIEKGALPKIKTLRIHGCLKLKMVPQGLPKSVNVDCLAPCVSGVENYNICPHAASAHDEDTARKMKMYREYLLLTIRTDMEREGLEAGHVGLIP